MYQVQEQPKQTFKYLQNILASVCLSSTVFTRSSPVFYATIYINVYAAKNDQICSSMDKFNQL